MTIVYFLLTHKNGSQVERLVRRLLSGSDSFVLVHHDAKSVPLQLVRADNLHLLENPLNVRWGHISIVHAIMKGFNWLEEARLPFDWLVLLSGQDYPIKPLDAIEAELQAAEVDAYVHHELIHENTALQRREFHRICWRRYFLRRVKLPGIRPFFIERRHPYHESLECYAGSAWLNLSRPAVEHLWSSGPTIKLLANYLRRASVPDETLFQTVLVNSDLRVENTDKRFIVWRDDADSPDLLGPDRLDEMLACDAWFARKFDERVSPDVLDQVDEALRRRQRFEA